ncbi:DUF1365 family protein [Litorivicinus lipolyticus]|nr:DUF1365 family protein [Litorivicinus lipolyticus]
MKTAIPPASRPPPRWTLAFVADVRLNGRLFHRRLRPIGHSFGYPLWMASHELGAGDPPRGIRNRRHLDTSNRNLRDKVQALATAHGLPKPDSITLLAQPSVLGIGFNPLSVFYLSHAGQPLALLLEVRNTPWREREVYVIPANGRTVRHRWQKTFHVSPFNPSGQSYDLHARWPDDGRFALDLSLRDDAGVLFRAGFRLAPLVQLRLVDRVGQALMPLITLGGIYYQALRLWLRGLPFQPYPKELKKG